MAMSHIPYNEMAVEINTKKSYKSWMISGIFKIYNIDK